jgi:hypothetical protein
MAPRLEALREAMLELARKESPAPVVQVPPGPDLSPYLQHLAKVLRALAERSVTPAPAVDLGPVMEQLTLAVKTMAERPLPAAVPSPAQALQRATVTSLSPDLGRQLSLVENALMPLERVAKRTLQSGEESLKAMQVWQAVTEALELLQSLQRPMS